MTATPAFARSLITWHRQHGRHDLPWQNTRDPYRVWLSEIMLQQTQVATVIPYYARFLECFPTVATLAAAPVDVVMSLWSGLGYYARARNLHRCAQIILAEYGGRFPHDPAALAALPGIGRSTANSIATFCFGARAPILDGNVKRVLCRAFGIDGFPGSAAVEKRLWVLAEALMPLRDGDIYNQAQMDLGASVCSRNKPRCAVCPLSELCVAKRDGRTAELPQRKPTKRIPEREATLLVVIDEHGRVLLETRPPAGIWGGLQSVPELPGHVDAAAVTAWLSNLLACTVGAVSPAPTFAHTFSHFRLLIRPMVLRVDRVATVMEARWHWLAMEALEAAALPAPVRTLLAQTLGSSPLSLKNR